MLFSIIMLQFSQFSDAGPSSYLRSDFLDDTHSIIQPDNQLLTLNLSYSQQSIIPTSSSDTLFLPSLPSTLHCLGLDYKKHWVLYAEMTWNDFVLWWLQTEFSSKPTPEWHHWDTKYHSKEWANFDQIAHYQTGEPMIMCKRCGKILPHPQQNAGGINSIKQYFAAG